MPETVLDRIVLVSSNPGDVVFDPFAGSGTTLASAKKLSRQYVGTELSEAYVESIRERLEEVTPIAELGPTPHGRWSPEHIRQLQALYMTAAVSTETLYSKPALLASLTAMFNWRIAHSGCAETYTAKEIWAKLEHLRKQACLGRIRVHADESPVGPARPMPKVPKMPKMPKMPKAPKAPKVANVANVPNLFE